VVTDLSLLNWIVIIPDLIELETNPRIATLVYSDV
jgi:hypothetical protein